MSRRVPIFATILVAGAVCVMIALGLWQLQRRDEKEALLHRYAAAVTMSAEVPFPADRAGAEALLFRHSRLVCARATGVSSMAGSSASGEAGLAVTAECTAPGGTVTTVVLGWSRAPTVPEWRGGEVRGVIGPHDHNGPRLIASPPLAGLAPNAMPDPSAVPNNHLAYAMQWFFFAAAAAVIYVLAVRRRNRG